MITKTNPFTESQLTVLEQVTHDLNRDQILWLSGYLEGRLAAIQPNGKVTSALIPSAARSEISNKLLILFGTDTGRSEALAKKLAKKSAQLNIEAQAVSMYDYNPRKLKEEEHVAVIVSTHGEGEPPAMAEDFHKFMTGSRAPRMEHVKYSVLALGDKSYKLFCQTGKDIDAAFTRQGATTLTPLITCDVDYEEDAEAWMNNLLQKVTPGERPVTNGSEVLTKATAVYTKKNPFMATVLEKVRITGRDSDKEVYHLELSLEDSGLQYEPGDALGIYSKNPAGLTEQIFSKTGFAPADTVILKTGEVTIAEAFTNHLEITLLTSEVVQNYFAKTGVEVNGKLNGDGNLADHYLYGKDLLDLLEDFPWNWEAQELADILRPLPPRLYSISSSQEVVGEEVHITVSLVRYEHGNRLRTGACSSYLSHCLLAGDKVPVYIEKNPAFRLPENGTPVIMVGAGTGIAPYRAFMQQRESQGIKSDSWLFFGDRRFNSDFLYQLEWQNYMKTNHLKKMDVAFSRDQQEKVYIQHKLLEHSKELFQWLEKGAHFYLCGDRKRLARDVNKTLLESIRTGGGISEEQAEKYVKQLKREKRFQSDVY
jgi:sulfite reductase (NADPH) flavoprotein alpha-component